MYPEKDQIYYQTIAKQVTHTLAGFLATSRPNKPRKIKESSVDPALKDVSLRIISIIKRQTSELEVTIVTLITCRNGAFFLRSKFISKDRACT
jgi:hypothetical protein